MSNRIKLNKQHKKFDIKNFVFFGGVIVLYFFYIKSKDEIINYPTWITYCAFSIVSIIIFLCHLKFFEKERLIQKGKDFYFSVAFILLKIIVISLFLTGIILIPFNYYNIYKSKIETTELVKCEIKGISTYSKNRSIFFVLKGRTNIIYGFTPIMEDIKKNEKFKDYYLVAKIKKGLFNSYILENWKIEKK